jgi:hypothetical protein
MPVVVRDPQRSGPVDRYLAMGANMFNDFAFIPEVELVAASISALI